MNKLMQNDDYMKKMQKLTTLNNAEDLGIKVEDIPSIQDPNSKDAIDTNLDLPQSQPEIKSSFGGFQIQRTPTNQTTPQ
jgi:hypothetical protein